MSRSRWFVHKLKPSYRGSEQLRVSQNRRPCHWPHRSRTRGAGEETERSAVGMIES